MGASTAKVFSNFMPESLCPGGGWWGDDLPNRLVVGPRIDVDRDRTVDADLRDAVAAGRDELPHRLVAVQAPERLEQLAREAERVAEAVVVAADRERGVAAAGQQPGDRVAGDAGLVAEQQHEQAGVGMQGVHRGRDRRRAALAV